MIGPINDFCPNTYTWCCLLGVSLPYLIICSPFLWYNVTPVIPALNAFFFAITVLSLLFTSFTDVKLFIFFNKKKPGIIPRK